MVSKEDKLGKSWSSRSVLFVDADAAAADLSGFGLVMVLCLEVDGDLRCSRLCLRSVLIWCKSFLRKLGDCRGDIA